MLIKSLKSTGISSNLNELISDLWRMPTSPRDLSGSDFFSCVPVKSPFILCLWTMRFQTTGATAFLVAPHCKPDISDSPWWFLHPKKSWQKGLERRNHCLWILFFPSLHYLSPGGCWHWWERGSAEGFYTPHPSGSSAHRGCWTNPEYLPLIWIIERCSDS